MLNFLQWLFGVFVVIYDGQHGLKFTLGRAQGVVGPGVRFKLPIIESYRVEDTRHTTLDLEPQVIQLDDDLVYEVDCKVMYQIVDLRKALIEIDDLVTGLHNRVVIAVQKVVQAQNRVSVLDTEAMVRDVKNELREVEEQWGVRILQFGFSNISPSPASLEITQLELLADERLSLYRRFRAEGLSPEAAVALVTGAVIATQAQPQSLAERARDEGEMAQRLAELVEAEKARPPRKSTSVDDTESEEEATEEGEERGDGGEGRR